MRVASLIPAFNPGPEFPTFVAALIARGAARIVVVDDGSGPEYRACFEEVAAFSQVHVCRHAINLGKGAALKTGINFILCSYADTSVVVTADADGQHDPGDVMAVAAYGEAHPDVLVLGARTFGGAVPLRSWFGNEATRLAMRVVVGERLRDTQTGLRAIPYTLLPSLLTVPTNGYDFELDMLLLCKHTRVPIHEVPIRTIYANENASSHFNPLRDSMRIYFVLTRFALTSLSAAIIDNVVFILLFQATGGIAISQSGARLVAMTLTFVAVKRLVFRSRGHRLRQFVSYVALVVVSGIGSFALIKAMVAAGVDVLRAKLLAEGFLFFGNFLIQRDVIFRDTDTIERAEVERQLRSAAGSRGSLAGGERAQPRASVPLQ